MKCKKIFIAIIVLILLLLNCNFTFAVSTEPNLVSEAAILIDSNTNKILYSKNADQKMYPASTTKILTAILTLENCNLDDEVTVSDTAILDIPEGYSSANLQFGEILTVEQLLQLLLVHSANDAANVLAEHVGGSIESFVSMMNTKVHDLGLENTHFTNAYGLHDENHYTTAYDLAIIMKYCVQNNDFRRIAGNASVAIPATNKSGVRKYDSTNDLIIPNSKNYYQYLTAGKTGFTTPAGECLVTSAYKNDIELICVILGGSQTVNNSSLRFSETKELYEYGYNNYSLKPIVSEGNSIYNVTIDNATKETENLDLIAENDINAIVSNDVSLDNLEPSITLYQNLTAPITEGTIIGSAEYDVDGVKYNVNLIASHNVEKFNIWDYSFYFLAGFLLILVIICLLKIRTKKR